MAKVYLSKSLTGSIGLKDSKFLIFAAIIIIASYLVKKQFFATDNELIFAQMNSLAQKLSKQKSENAIQIATKITSALEHFEFPVQVEIDYEKGIKRSIFFDDKFKLKESIAALKFRFPWLIVSFEDTQFEIDAETAITRGLIRLVFENKKQESVYDIYTYVFHWQKIQQDWLLRELYLEAKDTSN